MKKYIIGCVCYFLFLVAHAQEEPPSSWKTQLSWFLPTEQASASERQAYTHLLFAHAQKLAHKKQKVRHERAFLAKLYRITHRNFLKKYATNSPFAKTMQTGTYDCVSSVALFALMLEYTGYAYQIHETHNHVYIKVQTAQGEVVLETTSRTLGFVKYPAQEVNLKPDFRIISLKELAGLQFYNQALDAMQQENYSKGTKLLRKAKMLYAESPRINRLNFLATNFENLSR